MAASIMAGHPVLKDVYNDLKRRMEKAVADFQANLASTRTGRASVHLLDAVKIDLKAFTEKYYREVVTGQLKPVLDTLVTLRKMGKWTEIVYLVLPGMNDGDAEAAAAAASPRTGRSLSGSH